MNLAEHLGGLLSSLVELVFPPVCVLCEGDMKPGQEESHRLLLWRGHGICGRCLKEISWLVPPFCPSCALPIHSSAVSSHFCGECMADPPPFEWARALVVYDQEIFPLLHKMKYGHDSSLACFMGWLLAVNLKEELECLDVHLVVPIPLHAGRLRQRGFNQAAVMGRVIAKSLGVPMGLGLLNRHRYTPPQVGLNKIERRKNVRGAFSVKGENQLKGRKILLVDDVYTTGATLREASRELLKNGADKVYVMSFARVL